MTLPLRNSRLKLSQGRLFWHEMGQGPVVVFLHGSWEESSQWIPVIEQLSQEFHCLAPDLLGFGESEAGKVHQSIALQVEVLAEYLEALKVQSVYLVGHSLGSWVATRFALQHPDRVQGLLILAPEGLQLAGRSHRWRGARFLLNPLVGAVLRSLRPLAQTFRWRRLEQLWQRRKQLLKSPTACQLLFQRRWSEVKAEALQTQLPGLTTPVLVLQGGQDTSDASALCQRFVRLVPQAQFRRISGVSANLLQTHPDAIADGIRQLAAGPVNLSDLVLTGEKTP